MEVFINVIWYLSYLLTLVGFLALLNRGIQWVKDKVVESKVNVSGEYISEYEYMDKDVKVTRKAIATFKQRGTKITGTSYYHGMDQRFSFKAELIDHTRVSGYYVSTDLKHKAYGNMFLELKFDDVMKGTWSGYDGVHHILNGGKYVFYPILKNHKIVPMTQQHIQFIYDITEHTLGKGKIPIDYLKQCLDENTPTFGLSVLYHDKKTDKKSIVGFLMGTTAKPEDLLETIDVAKDDFPDAICLSDTVGWIDAIAVKPEFHKKGLGTKLVQAFEDTIREKGVHVFLACAQKHHEKMHLAGTLDLLNYKEAVKADTLLGITSKTASECQVCNESPCECRSIVYYKIDAVL